MKEKTIKKHGAVITVYEDGKIFRHPYVSKAGSNIKGKFLESSQKDTGYMKVAIKQKHHYLHRILAEAFLSGYCESLQVDHINGNKSDNRLNNLRMMTRAQNLCAHRRVNGTSRFRGVSWDKRQKKWRSQMKCEYIGLHECEEDAAMAVNKWMIFQGYPTEALNKVTPLHD